jgi:hypothetical protein
MIGSSTRRKFGLNSATPHAEIKVVFGANFSRTEAANCWISVSSEGVSFAGAGVAIVGCTSPRKRAKCRARSRAKFLWPPYPAPGIFRPRPFARLFARPFARSFERPFALPFVDQPHKTSLESFERSFARSRERSRELRVEVRRRIRHHSRQTRPVFFRNGWERTVSGTYLCFPCSDSARSCTNVLSARSFIRWMSTRRWVVRDAPQCRS